VSTSMSEDDSKGIQIKKDELMLQSFRCLPYFHLINVFAIIAILSLFDNVI